MYARNINFGYQKHKEKKKRKEKNKKKPQIGSFDKLFLLLNIYIQF